MATFYRYVFTKFSSYTDPEGGNVKKEVQEQFKETEGLLVLFKCDPEGRHKGLHFFYYFPDEPESHDQRYFNSSCGELVADNGPDIKLSTKDAFYTFSGEEKGLPLDLLLNANELLGFLTAEQIRNLIRHWEKGIKNERGQNSSDS